MSNTATAYQEWNARWQTDEGRQDWLTPDPAVCEAVRTMRARGGATALDLGAGVGRHALYMAQQGLKVHAVDASESGVDYCCTEAERQGLNLQAEVAMMSNLPFGDASFDFVLSFNVIYHGDPDVVAQTVAEVRRVLKPDGLFQGTLLSKRNSAFGVGKEIAPDTFVDSSASDDKSHPHFYCDAGGTVDILSGFELLSLFDQEQKRPGHWHWYFLAERR